MQYSNWTLQYAASQCWSLICSELIDRGADVAAADVVGDRDVSDDCLQGFVHGLSIHSF
jgi:hypothetical protein